MRDKRGVGSRTAADRHDGVRRNGDDRHRDVDPFEAFGQEGRAQRRRHREHRAHALVALGAFVGGEGGAKHLVAGGQGLGFGRQIAELGR